MSIRVLQVQIKRSEHELVHNLVRSVVLFALVQGDDGVGFIGFADDVRDAADYISVTGIFKRNRFPDKFFCRMKVQWFFSQLDCGYDIVARSGGYFPYFQVSTLRMFANQPTTNT